MLSTRQKPRQFKMLRCAIAGVEAVEADTRHSFSRHTHEQFGIGLIDRGAQRSLSGRGMVEAGPGDTITVNPGEVHDGAPIGHAGRSWRILYFDPSVVAEAISDASEGKVRCPEFPRPVMTDLDVARRFRELFPLMTGYGVRGSETRRDELLLMVLAHVADFPGRKRSAPKAISLARDLIDEDPAAPVTLADIARACGLSRFQALRGFAAATGLTPHAYLIQRRIDLARRLIARRTPLAEAALAAGFADQSHMTRVFVGKYGVTPGAYADAVA